MPNHPMCIGRIASLILVSCGLVACLHTAEAPLVLPKAAQTYLPAGSKLVKVARGDLNADGITDLIFVGEATDPKKITKRDDGFELNSNMRTIVVLLAEKQGYRKVGESAKFIPPAYTLEFDNYLDRFADIGIEKGVLLVKFDWFASAGTWGVSNETFKFRFEQGRMRLVGSDEASYTRNEGDMTLASTNYLTGKRKVTTGLNAFTDQPSHPKVTWENLGSNLPIYLENLSPCGRKE
jgi:hypothetical protein